MPQIVSRLGCLVVAVALLLSPAPAYSAETVDRVVAKLNDDIIMKSDLDEARARDARQGGTGVLDEELFGSLLDRLLLLQLARRQQTEISDTEILPQVDEALVEAGKAYGSEVAFREDLERHGMSYERLKQDLIRDFRNDARLYRVVASRFTVTETDAQRLAETSPTLGAVRLRRLGAKIVGTDAAAQNAAIARVNDLLAQINSERLPFVEGIRKYSQVPGSPQNGGDMGTIDLEDLSLQVRDAIEGLKPGQVTEPLITGEFASIFYVESLRDTRSILFEKRFLAEREKVIEELRAQARLSIYEKSLESLVPAHYRRSQEAAVEAVGAPTPPVSPSRSH